MLAWFPLRWCVSQLLGRWRAGVLGAWLLAAGVAPADGQPRLRGRKPVANPAAREASAAPADPPAVRTKLFQAASLANGFKDSEALAAYQEVLKLNPDHYLALWQAAVLSTRIGRRYTDETRKSAYFDAGRQYADRALALRPEGGESNYAVALALFNQATLFRAGARLAAFKELRSHVYLATERRPDLAEAWELRGRWQYRVSHYNLFERIYANLALGGVPAGGDSREAMECLERARRLDPLNLQFCYDLARMCYYQGRRRRAIEVLREAQKIAPVTSEDLVLSRLCRQMLPPLLRADVRRQRRLAPDERAPALRPAAPEPRRTPGDSISGQR